MKQHHSTVGLGTLCGLFGKTRQAFYDQQWRTHADHLGEHLIIERVREVRQQLPRTGGHKLLAMLGSELALHDITIGRDRFFELLREHGLLIRRSRQYARTTNSNHHYHKWPNLIERWRPSAPGQLWVSDITYLRGDNRFFYLSLVTDAYSRKIVGYHLSQQLKVKGCLSALQKALKDVSRPLTGSLIHHSDRGIQYCCDAYVSTLKAHGIKISMTQSGSPYDNAIAERVNGILKTELGLNKTFRDYGQAVAATLHAIHLYNQVRIHMSCGLLTPQQFHQIDRGTIKSIPCKAKSVSLPDTVKPIQE